MRKMRETCEVKIINRRPFINVNSIWPSITLIFQAYVDFMLTTTLPPPFCIFSIFTGLRPVIEYIKIFIKPPPGKRARWDFINCCYIVSILFPKTNADLILLNQILNFTKNRNIHFTLNNFSFLFLAFHSCFIYL